MYLHKHRSVVGNTQSHEILKENDALIVEHGVPSFYGNGVINGDVDRRKEKQEHER